jgi:hypothetical protein
MSPIAIAHCRDKAEQHPHEDGRLNHGEGADSFMLTQDTKQTRIVTPQCGLVLTVCT